jgi:hypothetical protein
MDVLNERSRIFARAAMVKLLYDSHWGEGVMRNREGKG